MDKTFIICRLGELKDIIQCLPTAKALKNRYPNSLITWVTHPYYAPLLNCSTALDYIIPLTELDTLLTKKFKYRIYHAALDLDGNLNSAFLMSKIKAKKKLTMYNSTKIAGFFSEKILPDSSSVHIVDQHIDVARSVGGTMSNTDFAIEPLHTDITYIKSKLRQLGISGSYIIIDPTPYPNSDLWDIKNYIRLISQLGEYGITCVLVGKSNEYNHYVYRQLIETKLLNVFSFIGKTNITQLLSLVSLSSAIIGQDNAISHLAAAMNVPSISLYSPTRPERCCPYGQLSRCFFDKKSINHIPIDSILQSVFKIFTKVY